MSNWFRSFFGEPEPPPGVCDCDDCKVANPDWYRMGMQPRKPKPRDLSRDDPGRFLESLLWLRDHHQEDEDDQSSGQSVEQWLSEKQAKKGASLSINDVIVGFSDIHLSSASGGQWTLHAGSEDDDE